MKIKWKCVWNVVKLYLLGACGSIIIIIGFIWLITLYLNSLPSPKWDEINTTNYALMTQGCNCGITTAFIPIGLIFIGLLGLIYFFYQDIKPCIIWKEE